MNTAEKIRLPDDCTIGYIVESVLSVPLTRSSLFHSHLENLQQVSKSEVHKQVRILETRLSNTISYFTVFICMNSYDLILVRFSFTAVMLGLRMGLGAGLQYCNFHCNRTFWYDPQIHTN